MRKCARMTEESGKRVKQEKCKAWEAEADGGVVWEEETGGDRETKA